MWILILLFGLATLVLAWTLFGYFLLVWFIGLFRPDRTPDLPERWPRLSLVVPIYNEAGQIAAKLENLRALDYPAERLEVVFVDGGSTDGTVELLERELAGDENARPVAARLVRSPRGGKIQQLNHVLPDLAGEIVVNTDADALLEPDALRFIAAEFAACDDVWVVGAYCQPADSAYRIDRYYWDAQNKARFIEGRASTSSIVVAPCYAFRRGLLERFPDDVVADDVYVAFLCNLQGKSTVYSRHARAVELRNPRSLSEFLPHKYRKSNAFLRECLRVLYRLPEMNGFCRTMVLTRIAQLLLVPWAMAWWLLLATSLVTLHPIPRYDVVVMAASVLVLLFALTSRAFQSVQLPGEGRHRHSLLTVAKGWFLTTIVLQATGLSYPFYRQGSSYARLAQAGGSGKSTEEVSATDEPAHSDPVET